MSCRLGSLALPRYFVSRGGSAIELPALYVFFRVETGIMPGLALALFSELICYGKQKAIIILCGGISAHRFVLTCHVTEDKSSKLLLIKVQTL